MFFAFISFIYIFMPIVNNSVVFTSYFYIFLLVVCVFALLHSSIACHKAFGIILKERNKAGRQKEVFLSRTKEISLQKKSKC